MEFFAFCVCASEVKIFAHKLPTLYVSWSQWSPGFCISDQVSKCAIHFTIQRANSATCLCWQSVKQILTQAHADMCLQGATGRAASALALSAVRFAEAEPCTQHHN